MGLGYWDGMEVGGWRRGIWVRGLPCSLAGTLVDVFLVQFCWYWFWFDLPFDILFVMVRYIYDEVENHLMLMLRKSDDCEHL